MLSKETKQWIHDVAIAHRNLTLRMIVECYELGDYETARPLEVLYEKLFGENGVFSS